MRNPGLIILAAGGSTRMGSPKQLLPWKGTTLLRSGCKVALETGCSPVMVVLGCAAEACKKEIEGLDLTIAVNPDWKSGMGSSLATGIKYLKQEAPDIPGAMIMLADQPTITANFLSQLSKTWKDSNQCILATQYPHGGGVPAIFPRVYFEELESLDSDQGARVIIARNKFHVRLVNFDGELIDIDDPETYRNLASF